MVLMAGLEATRQAAPTWWTIYAHCNYFTVVIRASLQEIISTTILLFRTKTMASLNQFMMRVVQIPSTFQTKLLKLMVI